MTMMSKVKNAETVLLQSGFELADVEPRYLAFEKTVDDKHIECEIDTEHGTIALDASRKDWERPESLGPVSLSSVAAQAAVKDMVRAMVAFCLPETERFSYLNDEYGVDHGACLRQFAQLGYFDDDNPDISGWFSAQRVLVCIQRSRFELAREEQPDLDLRKYLATMYQDPELVRAEENSNEVIVLTGDTAVDRFSDGETRADELAELGQLRLLKFHTPEEVAACKAGIKATCVEGYYAFLERDDLERVEEFLKSEPAPAAPTP